MTGKQLGLGSVGAVVLVLIAALVVRVSPAETAAGQPAPAAAVAAAVGTSITYQGRLVANSAPANGSYDFQFQLYDAALGGSQIGVTVNVVSEPVVDGYFDVAIDFGTSAFGGGARWLDIGIRPGASATPYTLLSPRQPLTAAPYALALPNVYTDEGANFVGVGRNFRISGNEVFGVRYSGNADQYGGMYVETAHANGWPFYGYATNGSFRAWTYYNGSSGDWHLYNAGIRLSVPNEGGLRIGPSLNYSLVISNTTGSDGIRVLDTGDDAIQIGSNPDIPNYGVYIPSPGVSTYGLWSNTSNASGEWALYSVDNVQAGNVLASGYSLLAVVTGPDALEMGDVVAVTDVAAPMPGGTDGLPQVRLADSANYTGLIGVVTRRMVWALAPGQHKADEGAMSMQSAEGAAQPGDYVMLTIAGVAQVKVAPGAAITAGERLTADSLPGHTRALQSRLIEGMLVTEGAPTLGVALETPVDGQKTIAVYVNPR